MSKIKKLKSACLIITDKNGHRRSDRKFIMPFKYLSEISFLMPSYSNIHIPSMSMYCMHSVSLSPNNHKQTIFNLTRKTARLDDCTYGPINIEGFRDDISDIVDYKNKYGELNNERL